uniref:GH16 domain-containing protein n=2 Tax=Timema TaxID=61471 RepID=A0A7R9H4P5_TIMPO|nr:unnamed protein product [Timema poppensis]
MKSLLQPEDLVVLLPLTTLDRRDVTKTASRKLAESFAWSGYCVGDTIFYDNFDDFEEDRWTHELWQPGTVNGEFQQYVNSRDNSYAQDSTLHIKVTADSNPVRSARMITSNSFAFKYGILEIRAKLPEGDWLWPAMWLLPKDSVYGGWPRSGEIDMIESRGNRQLTVDNGNIGVQQVASTLHWGPSTSSDAFMHATASKNNNAGYASDFHVYRVEWTKDHMKFTVDGEEIFSVYPSDSGFYGLGQLDGQENPWGGANNYKMAPFDQQFYIILNMAVGGNDFFPDNSNNPSGKPWSNTSPTASSDFWNARDQWLSTWQGDDAHLQVDYVKVFAV